MISNYIFYYLLIIGLAIIAYWIIFLYKNKTKSNYMKTHIIAEFSTGGLLIVSVISKSAELIPITLPVFKLIKGPPELPLLIGASV